MPISTDHPDLPASADHPSKHLKLPDSVRYVLDSSVSPQHITLVEIQDGYHIESQKKYKVWSADSITGMKIKTEISIPYSSYDPELASRCSACARDKRWAVINYIINQDYRDLRTSSKDIQEAIVYFSSHNPSYPFYLSSTALAIIKDAEKNGEAFAPTFGQKVAVILYTRHRPTKFIEVPLNQETFEKGIQKNQSSSNGGTNSGSQSAKDEESKLFGIRSLSPASRQVGTQTTYLYIFGNQFCQLRESQCSSNPKVFVTDPNGKNYSEYFQISRTFPDAIRGDFQMADLKAGAYTFVVVLPSGERSNPGTFQITPRPPPEATSAFPALAFRGNGEQEVSVVGNNFAAGDFVICNNDTLNPIPGTVSENGRTLKATIDISDLKYAGRYPLYVVRCLDPGCTKSQKTLTVYIRIQDPPCLPPHGIDCAKSMKPSGSEICGTIDNQKVCRPTCTSTAACQSMKGAPSNATCSSGYCQ